MRENSNIQMKKVGVGQIFMIIVFVMLSHLAYAADIGAPITKADVNGVVRAELIYEKYDRKVEFSKVDFTAVGPGGTASFTVDGDTGKQEEDRIMLRLIVPVSDKMSFHGDIGTIDSKDSEGAVPLFGAGLKYVGYNKNDTKIGLFVQGHYISEIEYKAQDIDAILGPGTYTQKESYYEISTGLTVAKVLLLDEQTNLIPYAGAMISFLNGKEDFKFQYPSSGVVITGKGDLNDNGIFAVIAGADLKFESNFGIHMEGRFVNQSSVSASLFMSF